MTSFPELVRCVYPTFSDVDFNVEVSHMRAQLKYLRKKKGYSHLPFHACLVLWYTGDKMRHCYCLNTLIFYKHIHYYRFVSLFLHNTLPFMNWHVLQDVFVTPKRGGSSSTIHLVLDFSQLVFPSLNDSHFKTEMRLIRNELKKRLRKKGVLSLAGQFSMFPKI